MKFKIKQSYNIVFWWCFILLCHNEILCFGNEEEILVKNLKILLSEKSTGSGSFTAEFPNKALNGQKFASTKSLEIEYEVNYKGSGYEPQQCFIMLKSEKYKIYYYEVAKKIKTKYNAKIAHEQILKKFNELEGKLDVFIVIGDPRLNVNLIWDLGSLNVVSSASEKRTIFISPLYLNRDYIRPEIYHIFNEPTKRPSEFISYAFSILTLIPLFILLGYFSQKKLNNMPNATGDIIWIILFHGTIASILILYFIFWIKLNLIQMAPILAILCLLGIFSGNKALCSVAKKRLSKKKKS